MELQMYDIKDCHRQQCICGKVLNPCIVLGSQGNYYAWVCGDCGLFDRDKTNYDTPRGAHLAFMNYLGQTKPIDWRAKHNIQPYTKKQPLPEAKRVK
jgi:hypothetical protein